MAKKITDTALFPDRIPTPRPEELIPDIALFPNGKLGAQNTQILHLFEFTLADSDNLNPQIIRFTDNDLFITIDGQEYIPTKISFNMMSLFFRSF